ncbi:hypothetical protein Tco_1549128 [Tanacetum coccineum]
MLSFVIHVYFGKWVSYKGVSNGEGVRQGDQLSHFLFILAAEGLNDIVHEVVTKGIFKGVLMGKDKEAFELKVNLNKSRLYRVGVSSGEVEVMARHISCSVGEFTFMYLGLPIDTNMRRVSTWRPVAEKVKKRLSEWRAKTMSFGKRLTLIKSDNVLASYGLGGLNIVSLRAKNWALVGKWWWRFWVECDARWVKVIRSIHGSDEGLTGREGFRDSNNRGGWNDIVRVSLDIDKVGIEFTSSIVKNVGSGNNTNFWIDRWVGNQRLCDIFPREPRGRGCGDLEQLPRTLNDISLSHDCRDSWKWTPSEDNQFTVKSLARVVDEKRLQLDQSGHETVWNKLIMKKVNVFVWRVLKGRLPVLTELDKRDDLTSIRSAGNNGFVNPSNASQILHQCSSRFVAQFWNSQCGGKNKNLSWLSTLSVISVLDLC